MVVFSLNHPCLIRCGFRSRNRQIEAGPNMSAENEAIALNYYKRLYSSECTSAVSTHLSDDYVEHQYTARFSKEGLLDYVRGRMEQNPGHRIVVHKVICEGDSVFLLVEEKLDGGISVARAELFRL